MVAMGCLKNDISGPFFMNSKGCGTKLMNSQHV